MVEGSHTDSSKKHHIFDADRIYQIVENTNNWLAKGGRVPWQLDHKKTQDANIGDLESGLEARVITLEDLPNPRLRHLVGKIGAFAERLVGKGGDVVNMVAAGRVKTLSPGIDVRDDIIKEISATPTPAIVGLSTFRQASGNFALTMDEAESEEEQEDAAKQAFVAKGEVFLEVINSIRAATADELQGQDPQALLMQALEDYSSRVVEILGIAQEEQQNNNYNPNVPYQQGTQIPGYLPQQQGFPPNQSNMASMSRGKVLAAFTLADMEKVLNHERAEFLFEMGNNNNNGYKMPRMPWNPAPPPQKKNGSLLGKAVKLGAVAAGGAAAIRYGRAGFGGAANNLRTNLGSIAKNAVQNGGKGFKRGVIGTTARGAYTGASSQIGKDFNAISSGVRRVGSAIGTGVSSGYNHFRNSGPKVPKTPRVLG